MVKGILEMFDSGHMAKTVDISCEAYLKDGGIADCVVRVCRYVDLNEEDSEIEVTFGVGTVIEIDSECKNIERIVPIYDFERHRIEKEMSNQFGSGYSIVIEEEIVIL